MNYNWYQNAIMYSLDIERYLDTNGDGIGDIQGLLQRLEYLASLGVSCLWLLPFFTSPNRDNGYDVADYYNIDSRLGNGGDFAQLMDKAGALGIKVIIDLVVNHTSITHPWFQQARSSRDNPYRDYYVWSDEPLPPAAAGLSFQGEENTMWSWDEQAGQYYLHRFYKEQPDLNIQNPAVRQEILKIMGFWLRMGVSGFRVDAAAIIIEPYGIQGAEQAELELFFEEMRHFLDARRTDAILLAEANIKPEHTGIYFKGASRMNMMFNFFVNQHLFLALARRKATPLIAAVREMPGLEPSQQWLNFLRHHDELTLDLLSEAERQEIYDCFGPQEHMRIYERGIRRRLAPMMQGRQSWIRFCYSLLFSLPGTPMIRYGDELGMGDDLSLKGRNSVRTAMQWSREPNGGFSASGPGEAGIPVIDKGPFNYHELNVLDAQSRPDSLLNWIGRLMRLRRQCPEIGAGNCHILDSGHESLMLHRFQSDVGELYFLHNFSDKALPFRIRDFAGTNRQWIHLLGSRPLAQDADELMIEGHGFHWWRPITP